MTAMMVDPTSIREDVKFPQVEDLQNFTSATFTPPMITIPQELLMERQVQANRE